MKKKTYTFEFSDSDLAEAFRKEAGMGFDHRIYGETVKYSDGSKLPPRVLVHGTDSIIYDMRLLKELKTRASEKHGILVAINGKPVYEDGTPWED